MKRFEEMLYEIRRNGVVFRSFPARGNALAYLAAARELCPDDHWTLTVFVSEVSGNV